jgi:streptogramin lyase
MRSGTTPVNGAAISLYAAGSGGAGTGATNLLPGTTITTDSAGNFSVPVFTCPASASQIYLVGRGGNPSSGTDNPAMVMMAPLGDCSGVSSSTTVVMNEVTTVASAWALAPFLGANASVGATATNAIGLGNAFLTTGNLVDTSKGSAPGALLPSTAILETAKLNSLANILVGCDQSASGTACQTLFSAATEAGATPGNTLDAALAIVRQPAANVSTLFGLQANGPFQPALTSAPNDWTLSVTYGNCTSGCGGLNLPGSVAIDSTGNVWVANYFGGAASKFSATGVPASPNGFAATGLEASYGITVDAQDSVWITNENGTSASGTVKGSITHLSSTGQNLSGTGYTGGGIYYPVALAATPGGNIWIADYANSAATLMASNGTALSGGSGDAADALLFTTAVAVDASQNGWFTFQGGIARVTPDNAVTSFSCCEDPEGIAIDASGQVWIADYRASAVIKLSAAGAVLGQATTGGLYTPSDVAIDGSGNAWVVNYHGNTLSEFAGATMQALSPNAGYGPDALLAEPFGLAIDGSGNVWTTNAGSSTLTEFVGAASPVKTPLLGEPVQP